MLLRKIKNYWTFISFLGVSERDYHRVSTRKIIFSNKIALIIAISTIIGFFTDLVSELILRRDYNFLLALRILYIAPSLSIIPLLHHYKFHKLAKSLVPIIPTFFILFFPFIINQTNNQFILIYPIFTLSLSLIIPLVFSFRYERPYFIGFSLLYLLIISFHPNIIDLLSGNEIKILDLIRGYYLPYSLSLVFCFSLIMLIVSYVTETN
ncbi:MAG: hypothetical protein RIS47_479, partial [Bacteroidota bacterium]